MSTLREVETAVLSLHPFETHRLAEWLEDLLQDRRRVMEARTGYSHFERHPMTFEEYLQYEANWRIRHEYLADDIFAMRGASPRRNRISGRVYGAFGAHLEGVPCEAYVGDVQVNLSVNQDQHAYYPDVMVACWRERPGGGLHDQPEAHCGSALAFDGGR